MAAATATTTVTGTGVMMPLVPFSPTMTHSDRERWVCIYPAYINSKKTRQEGRILRKDMCVENPSYQEIKDVLGVTNMRLIIENKLYSRERSKELLYRGRIRIQLKNDDGTPFNKDYPTRESLLVHIGKTIPQLKSRQNKPAGEAGSSTGQNIQASSSSSSSGAQKKGGKGKRR